MNSVHKKPQLLNIEFYIDAATRHAEISESDHEVGDLQSLLRLAWDRMTPEQKVSFARDPEVHEILEVTCDLTEPLACLDACVPRQQP